jgi:TP53 regulating kinase-like protein
MKLMFLGEINDLKLIHIGAEAKIYFGKFIGVEAIYKIRERKSYRAIKIDENIRKNRTLNESKNMMRALKVGINVPAIYFVDPIEGIIIMEFINGKPIKDLIDKREEELATIGKKLGEILGKFHKNNIIHGDFTTSNIIVNEKGYFVIDFGLSKISNSMEDIGTDVHLFFRCIESTHSSFSNEIKNGFNEGYSMILGKEFLYKVSDKVQEIRSRGRYVWERRKK